MQAISRYEAELRKNVLEKTNVAARIGFFVEPEEITKALYEDSILKCDICFRIYNKTDHLQSCITVYGHMFGKTCIERNFTITNCCGDWFTIRNFERRSQFCQNKITYLTQDHF